MRSIGILIFDGVEELDFVGPWEVFTMANNVAPKFGMDAPFAVHLIAESLTPVRCAKNMRVLPDATTADTSALDILLVPGGMGTRQKIPPSWPGSRKSRKKPNGSPRSAPALCCSRPQVLRAASG